MRVAVVALAFFVFTRPAAALTVRAISVDELVARAERIVRARCLAVEPLAGTGVPTVEITLGVEESLKGQAAEQLVIHQLGGQWTRVLPTCTPGDEVVLFLHAPSRLGLTSPVGMEQGYLRVLRRPNEPARLVGDAHVVRALAGAASTASGARLGTHPSDERSAPLDAALDGLRATIGRVR